MSTGTAIGTTIDSGGNQLVGVGGAGMATSTTIDSGGSQNVGEDTKSATASATATTISGGIQVVGDFGTGTATDTTIDSGGVQYVGSQGTGTATDTTIDSGGAQYVGIAEGEGTATTTTIYGGGIQYVGYNPFAMGTATDTTIDSGGTQYVGDDGTGTASGTTISGGEQVVSSGGTATDTTIYSGGAADVLSGGVVDTPVIDGGTIELAKGASVGGRIDFAADSGADGGALDLTGEGSGLTFTPLISGFTGTGDTAALSDILKVTGSAATDQVFWTQSGASGTLDVETQAGGMLASMKLDGTYDQNQFALNYAAGVDQITYAACYVRGTRVLTDRGDVAVEALRVGEFVVTASGGRRPIVWIGHRGLDLARHPDPLAVKPVRVRAGAFGEGSPRRDLWLSPGHNVAFAGALMPISALINAASVAQMDWDRVEYWHVELDAHDILLAEGLPAESYLDTGNRTAFANGGAFVEAHPDFRPKHWAQTCLPLRKEGAEVVAARARLRARLEQRGYAVTAEADPHILVDGVRINPSRLSPTCLAFDLPPGRASIFLCSRAFIPATVFPGSEDLRALGLSVARLQIDRDEVDLGQDDAPGAGWHAPEREGVFFTRRWTNGSAALPPGARFVMVDLASEGLYWREPEGAAAARESVARGEARGCRA
jgi:autotransporter passenger strand-loop-strand repeat protein